MALKRIDDSLQCAVFFQHFLMVSFTLGSISRSYGFAHLNINFQTPFSRYAVL